MAKFSLPHHPGPEQQAYEELRPMVLFGDSVAERAKETGTPERTMYRRVERFEKDGMLSLFGTDPAIARAKRRGLEPDISAHALGGLPRESSRRARFSVGCGDATASLL